MQHEFDNPIDLLLRRQTRRSGEIVFADDAHLEPDEIAAFAEDVLSPPARARSVAHFADCGNCRRILANFLLINETEQEVLAAAPETILIAPKLSVRERFANFFTLPVLGYGAAAMMILLVGSFAFVALRSSQKTDSAMVVLNDPEKAEKAAKTKSQSAPVAAPKEDEQKDAPPTPEPTADDLNTGLNEPFPTPESTPDGLPPSVVATKGLNANNTIEARRPAAEPTRDTRPTGNAASSSSNSAVNAAPIIAQTQPGDDKAAESESDRQRRETKEKQAELARNKPETADGVSSEAAPLKTDSLNAAGAATAARRSTLPAPRAAVETRSVGGKSFARENGVWKDSAYGKQNLNTVRRGSDEYKKLDAGLRSIAESLGGEAIIVWQGKSYKIQ